MELEQLKATLQSRQTDTITGLMKWLTDFDSVMKEAGDFERSAMDYVVDSLNEAILARGFHGKGDHADDVHLMHHLKQILLYDLDSLNAHV